MLIGQHISSDYHEVLLTDNIDFVLNKMDELRCQQMAVVENGFFYGIIEETTLLDEVDSQASIEKLQPFFKKVSLFDYQHVYDALQLMAAFDYCFIPIIDKDQQYVGSITKQNIVVALNEILGDEESAILVIELGARDNALSHIARIIEAENTIIYSTAIHQIPNSSKLEMTIKVNRKNLSAVTACLWRNQYVVKATFRDVSDASNIQSNYQHLMNYLDI